MTGNRRILLNIVATYGRSVYALLCGLFVSRWVLMTLGEIDYGLLGVVGGIVGLLSYLNNYMRSAVTRFYAFSIGQAQTEVNEEKGIDDCCQWFNSAVIIHIIIACITVLLLFPIGTWAIHNFLKIPLNRLDACESVLTASCFASFFSMVTVPYSAMYTAKQEIAELTIYDFARTTFNVLFIYYMVTHPADWLARYAWWQAIVLTVPSLIIALRTFSKYPECRFKPEYFFNFKRIQELVRYAGLRMLASISMMLSFESMPILVNKMLGPARNAAMTIGSNVTTHVLSLTGAMSLAMGPAITSATGAGDQQRVRTLVRRMDVYASLAVAVFAIPLCIEMDYVLKLWLKKPPAQAGVLCLLLLISKFIYMFTIGEQLSIMALREIGKFQICDSISYLIPFLVAFFVFCRGGGLEGVGIGFIVLYFFSNMYKLLLARLQCGLSIREWFFAVLLPVLSVVFVSLALGLIPELFMKKSFLRLVITTTLSNFTLLLLTWNFILTSQERQKFFEFIKHKVRSRDS